MVNVWCRTTLRCKKRLFEVVNKANIIRVGYMFYKKTIFLDLYFNVSRSMCY